MADINEVLGNLSKDKQGIKDEIGFQDNVIPIFKVDAGTSTTPNKLDIFHSPTIIKLRDTGPDTIWGLFNWGEANWDGTYNNSRVTYRIMNAGNIFREYFRSSTFIDTANTTATVNTTAGRIEF